MPGFIINGQSGAEDGLDQQPNGRVEVKRTYRWTFMLLETSGGGGEYAKSFVYLQEARRPTWSHGTLEQKHNQEQIWHIGQTTWDDLELKWYDAEQEPDVCKAIYDWMDSTVYQIPVATPAHPRDYKKTSGLNMLDHAGRTIESWQFYNSWPFKVSTDNLSYTSANLMTISLTLKYDRATKVV